MTQLFTIGETAKILRISKPTVRRHIKAGTLSIVRIGTRVLLSEAQVAKAATEGIPSEPEISMRRGNSKKADEQKATKEVRSK